MAVGAYWWGIDDALGVAWRVIQRYVSGAGIRREERGAGAPSLRMSRSSSRSYSTLFLLFAVSDSLGGGHGDFSPSSALCWRPCDVAGRRGMRFGGVTGAFLGRMRPGTGGWPWSALRSTSGSGSAFTLVMSLVVGAGFGDTARA